MPNWSASAAKRVRAPCLENRKDRRRLGRERRYTQNLGITLMWPAWIEVEGKKRLAMLSKGALVVGSSGHFIDAVAGVLPVLRVGCTSLHSWRPQ